MLNSAQRRHLLGFADSFNHQYNSMVQNQNLLYFLYGPKPTLILSSNYLQPSHNIWTFPIPFTSFFGNFWYTRRTGGGGKACYHSTVDPRPAAVHLPQLREVAPAPPLEHGLDLRTSCFLAATASLLSSFTRDSDLEGEPPLADATLVVPKSHVFTLSAWTLGFGSFGLFSFGFRISDFGFHHRFWSPAAQLLVALVQTQLNVPGKEY